MGFLSLCQDTWPGRWFPNLSTPALTNQTLTVPSDTDSQTACKRLVGEERDHGLTGCVGISGSGDSVVKNPPTNAGDTGSIPGSGRSPGGQSNPLQYSCLENSTDREFHGELQSMGCKDLDMTEQLTLSLSFLTRKRSISPFLSLAVPISVFTYLCIYLFIYSPSIPPSSFYICVAIMIFKSPISKEKKSITELAPSHKYFQFLHDSDKMGFGLKLST